MHMINQNRMFEKRELGLIEALLCYGTVPQVQGTLVACFGELAILLREGVECCPSHYLDKNEQIKCFCMPYCDLRPSYKILLC